MAVLKAYMPIDMTGTGGGGDPIYLTIEEANATTIRLSNGYFTDTYRGRFQYDYDDNVYGRVDSLTSDAGGQLILSISEINRDAHTVADFVYAANISGFLKYVFSGDDLVYGSRFGDVLLGFDGYDRAVGGGGNDTMFGAKGLDRLFGGNGADHLDGGAGGDLMAGGMGNDRYYADSVNDRIAEAGNQGVDVLFTTVSRGMAANVENLTLLGNSTISGIGNGLANLIRGNGAGNALLGGAGDDWIFGGDGNDRVTGGAGNDHVVGGTGADVFFFAEAGGRDIVHAFERGLDRLHLAGIDADATVDGDQAFTFVGSADFSGTTGDLRYADSILSGDADGEGAADFQVQVANDVNLTLADLVL